MLVDTNCTECGATQRVDISLAGTKRTCSACGQRFLYDVPQEQAAQMVAHARAEAHRPAAHKLERLGCMRCMASYNKKLAGDEDQVACIRCGQHEATATAREHARRFDALEKEMWDAVQRGDEARAETVLVEAGLDGSKCRERVSNAVALLPFVRSEWQYSPPDEHPVLAPPQRCDTCDQVRPLGPCRVLWLPGETIGDSLVNLTMTSGSDLVGGLVGGAVGSDLAFMAGRAAGYKGDFAGVSKSAASGVERLEGLYFLCSECEAKGPKAFVGHRRFPAGSGLLACEVQAVTLG